MSACAVDALATTDRHGGELALVVAKLTIDVSPTGLRRLSADPSPVRWRDVPFGSAGETSIRYPSDAASEKPGTDVLVIGTCHPPADGRATSREVRLRVAARGQLIDKSLRVYGARVWTPGFRRLVPSAPATLKPTPLRYELAYGGRDEPRNPIGTGASRSEGQLTPCIEDPRAPLAPAGFGPIARHWQPRAQYLGTCDAHWQRTRAPVLPVDFDPRHACVAPPDQWCNAPLEGDIHVETHGLCERGPWSFTLPAYAPAFRYRSRGEVHAPSTHLDTLLIDAERGRVELTWRAAIPLRQRPTELEYIYVYSHDDRPLRDAIASGSMEDA